MDMISSPVMSELVDAVPPSRAMDESSSWVGVLHIVWPSSLRQREGTVRCWLLEVQGIYETHQQSLLLVGMGASWGWQIKHRACVWFIKPA